MDTHMGQPGMTDGTESSPLSALDQEVLAMVQLGIAPLREAGWLLQGRRLETVQAGVPAMLGIGCSRMGEDAPVVTLEKRFPEDGILRPVEGSASVEVSFACRGGVVYELLNVYWLYEAPGREPIRIPLQVCGDGTHDIWFSSMGEALAAGAVLLAQATGGFVADALGKGCLPTDLPEFLPTNMAEPENDFAGTDEVIP